MRNLCFFMFFLALGSCNFEKTIPQKEELLNQRLQEIDWNEITRYPSFSSCDSLTDKIAHKKCFLENLTQQLQQRFIDTLSGYKPKTDTIFLKITIKADATLIFEPQLDRQQNDQFQKIDSLIKTRLYDFPLIEPAQKNGIPIKTEFLLPIIFKQK